MRKQLINPPQRYDGRPHGLSHAVVDTATATVYIQAMGVSPDQYVIQQRVEQAKLMLSKTDLAIADIALQVGFSSQSHLTQQFKRITGMTPKQVR
jgi:AraC family transcriptional regulator